MGVKDHIIKTELKRKKERPNLEIRKRIYEYILIYPGLHKRELSRRLKIPKTTLSYHLSYLEKHNFIILKSEGRYKRYYVAKIFGNAEKKFINVIRQETPRNILLYIRWAVSASQIELSKELELSPKTIEKHLKKLVENAVIEIAPVENGVIYSSFKNRSIIDRIPVGREKIYISTRPASTLISNLFSSHKKGLVNDDTTKLVLDGLNILFHDRVPAEKIGTTDVILGRFEKKIYDIFPHPYHV